MSKTLSSCLAFGTLLITTATYAGCKDYECCCKHTNDMGGTSYICTQKSTDDCQYLYNGACLNDDKKCASSRKNNSNRLHPINLAISLCDPLMASCPRSLSKWGNAKNVQ